MSTVETAPGVAPEIAIDPVCGMKVKVAGARNTAVHEGRTFYFCNPKCLAKFTAEPGRYLRPAEAVARPEPPAKPGAIYTCPMHPEVRQAGPGSCPSCGMALEPAEITLDEGPNEELLDMTRRFWVGLAFALPVVALEMGAHLFDLHALVSAKRSAWLQMAFATPVVLWAGWPLLQRGAQSLANRALNMFTLIALGVLTAWAYSMATTLAPGLFPGGRPPVYFESAAAIVVLALDRKSTRLNSSHVSESRMPSSA